MIHTGTHIGKERIHQRYGTHGLYHHHCPGDNDRVVPSLNYKGDIFVILGNGLLRLADGRSGLYGCPKDNLASIADAAHDASGMIRGFSHGSIYHGKTVVVIGTF